MQQPIGTTPQYASYLLRLRWSRQDSEWVCQIILTNVTTHQQYYFADLARLFTYLSDQAESQKGETPAEPHP